MAKSSQRRFFPAVTTVVVVLALFGTLSVELRKAIPPPPANGLVDSPGDYVQAGAHQYVKWYPLGPEAFAEAKRLDRPLFIAIGAEWSQAARQADTASFLNQDVVERLRQGYVCVRVDIDQHPEWLNAYLPLSRALISDSPERQLWFEPSFQTIILDPSEMLVSWILRHFASERMEPPFFLGSLTETQDRIRGAREKRAGYPAAGQVQAGDLQPLLAAQPATELNLETHLDWLRGHIDRKNGGQPTNGFQLLQPNVWKFMLQAGAVSELRASLDPALKSGIVDWIDGGFFRIADDPSWRQIEFDKLAVQNAEMMAMLSRAWRQTGDKYYLELAIRTFDCLAGPFMKDGLVNAYRTVETSQDRRSARSSFGPQQLRENFSAEERDWLRANLGLRIESNPQMVPEVLNPERFNADLQTFNKYFAKLRTLNLGAKITYGSPALLDVNGFVCARMLETARLIQDKKRSATAAALFDKLSEFRVGVDDVVHGLEDSARAYYYLGDYLAYADAAFEHYRSFGIIGPLKDGAAVLKRALFLFKGDRAGVLVNGTMSALTNAPPDSKSPEIVDNIRESTLAMAARLTYSYGAVLQDQKLQRDSAEILLQYGATANAVQNVVSGLFCAQWLVHRDRVALLAYRESDASSANELQQMSANHPNDLIARSPVESSDGWFLFRGGKLAEGPTSDNKANSFLSAP